MKTSIAFQLQKSISVQMYMCATLTSDITRAFALRSCRTPFALSIRPHLLQNSIRPGFALSSFRTAFALHLPSALAEQPLPLAFALSVRPQLLQNNIRPQLLQNGKFLLQALPPIVGLTLFGFFWSIPLDCVRL